jgi:hypothetical protein
MEDCLTSFVAEARAEPAIAEASDAPKAVAQSQTKERLMSFARSSNFGMARLGDLRKYFELHSRPD